MARVGIVTFPGSNCERETLRSFAAIAGVDPEPLWHKDRLRGEYDLIVLPGGFSYGDYLRCGAIARFSPLMADVIEHAHVGGYVLGICNGFQILTESGLLPGALIRNKNLRYLSITVSVRVERNDTPWTAACKKGQVLQIPIAHGEGNYVHHAADFAELEKSGQVLLRYCDAQGNLNERHNLNGAMGATAGIVNKAGNVFGLMPHPERAANPRLGLEDGAYLLNSIVEWINTHHAGDDTHDNQVE